MVLMFVGLNRVHQFDKVEIVQIAHPDKSYDIHLEMVEHVERLAWNSLIAYWHYVVAI